MPGSRSHRGWRPEPSRTRSSPRADADGRPAEIAGAPSVPSAHRSARLDGEGADSSATRRCGRGIGTPGRWGPARAGPDVQPRASPIAFLRSHPLISLVPSPTIISGASRKYRSTSYRWSSRSRRGRAPHPARSASRSPSRTVWPCRPPCRRADRSRTLRRRQRPRAAASLVPMSASMAHGLVLPDRLAEALPILRVGRASSNAARQPRSLGRPPAGARPRGPSSSVRSPDPAALQQSRCRHPAVGEVQFCRPRRPCSPGFGRSLKR